MKQLWIHCCLWAACGLASAFAQSPPERLSRFTYSAKLTFQAYGLPFQNVRDGFKNVGVALGADYAYNSSGSVLQSVTVGYQGHTEHEQSFYLSTQFSYRPLLFHRLEPTISLGVGRLFSYSNSKNPYYEVSDGSWERSSKQGQGHWFVPLSVSLGYQIKSFRKTLVTPFIGYEVNPILDYNAAFPILPYSLVTAGTRIKISHSTH